jgi:hypothetical protein
MPESILPELPPAKALPSQTRAPRWAAVVSKVSIPLGGVLLAVGLVLLVAAATFPLRPNAVEPVGKQTGLVPAAPARTTDAQVHRALWQLQGSELGAPGPIRPGSARGTPAAGAPAAATMAAVTAWSLLWWGIGCSAAGALLLTAGLYALSLLPVAGTPQERCVQLYQRYMVGGV